MTASLRMFLLALLVLVVTSACGKSSMSPTPPTGQPLSVTPLDVQIGVNSTMAVEVSSGSNSLESSVVEGQVGVQRLNQIGTPSFWSLSGKAAGPFKVAFRDNGSEGQATGTIHDKAFVRLVPNEALSAGATQPCGGTYKVGQDIIFWVDAILGPGEARGQAILYMYDSQGQGFPGGTNGMGGPNQFTGSRFRSGLFVSRPMQIATVKVVLKGDGGYTDILTQASYPCQINVVP